MAIDLSWKENRKSLIVVISVIAFLLVMNITGGGLIVGAIVGAVVFGGLSWILEKILPESQGVGKKR